MFGYTNAYYESAWSAVDDMELNDVTDITFAQAYSVDTEEPDAGWLALYFLLALTAFRNTVSFLTYEITKVDTAKWLVSPSV